MLAFALLLMLAPVRPAAPMNGRGPQRGEAARPAHWVGTWSCSPQLVEPRNMPPQPGLSNTTLRQRVEVSIGGRLLRLHLSNQYGHSPMVIRSARIALPAGPGAIVRATDRALTFHGRRQLTLPPGATAVSDPLRFRLRPLAQVTISLAFGAVPHHLTGHPGSRQTSFIQPGDIGAAATFPDPQKTVHWYVITGLDIRTRRPAAAVAVFGDSLTDGHGTTTDGNNRWTDDLARRLLAHRATRNVAVLNEGIGGNCTLKPCLGPAGVTRFRRDVLDQAGVRWVILWEGVNDIGTSHAPVAKALIAADRHLIALAHAHHLRIYAATITPFGKSFYDSPAHRADWRQLNHWIRHSGAFDGVVDFSALARDPAHPDRLRPADDFGDHLHFQPSGYARLAVAVPLRWFASR